MIVFSDLYLLPAAFLCAGVVRQPRIRPHKGGHAEGHRAGGGFRAISECRRPPETVLPDGDQARPGAQEAHRLAAR